MLDPPGTGVFNTDTVAVKKKRVDPENAIEQYT